MSLSPTPRTFGAELPADVTVTHSLDAPLELFDRLRSANDTSLVGSGMLNAELSRDLQEHWRSLTSKTMHQFQSRVVSSQYHIRLQEKHKLEMATLTEIVEFLSNFNGSDPMRMLYEVRVFFSEKQDICETLILRKRHAFGDMTLSGLLGTVQI